MTAPILRFLHSSPHQIVLAALLVVFILVTAAAEPSFARPSTQLDLATQVFELALLAVPMTLILLTGGIDLSIGSSMALAAVVLGLAYEAGAPVGFAAGLAVLTGAAAGFLNGSCVAGLGIHPLIVTLATLSLYRGLAEGISLARPISGFPAAFTSLSSLNFASLPLPGWVFVAALAAAWIMLRFTALGRSIYAVGANEVTCRFSGVRVDRLKLLLYTLSGVGAGMAAVMFAARRNTAKADVGSGMELDVITAVVLGGTSVYGGRGGLGGTVLGVVLLHEVRQFVSWRWNNDELILIVVGALLVGSVLLNRVLGGTRA